MKNIIRARRRGALIYFVILVLLASLYGGLLDLWGAIAVFIPGIIFFVPFLPGLLWPRSMEHREFGPFYLLLCALGTGVLSSFAADWQTTVRSCILSVALAAALLIINRIERTRLAPRFHVALGIGALTGGLIGLCMALVPALLSPPIRKHVIFEHDMTFFTDPFHVFLMALCYGALFHSAYNMRWRLPHGSAPLTMLFLLAAGALCSLLRAGPELMFYTGIPFALFWGLAVMGADPAAYRPAILGKETALNPAQAIGGDK